MKSIFLLLFVAIQSFAQTYDISKCTFAFYQSKVPVTPINEMESGVKMTCGGDITLIKTTKESQSSYDLLTTLLTHMSLEGLAKGCNYSNVEFTLANKQYISWADCSYSKK